MSYDRASKNALVRSAGPGVYSTTGGIIDELVLHVISRRSVKIKLVNKIDEMVPHWTSILHRSTSLLYFLVFIVALKMKTWQ